MVGEVYDGAYGRLPEPRAVSGVDGLCPFGALGFVFNGAIFYFVYLYYDRLFSITKRQVLNVNA